MSAKLGVCVCVCVLLSTAVAVVVVVSKCNKDFGSWKIGGKSFR